MKYIIKWKEANKYYHRTQHTTSMDYCWFTEKKAGAHQFNILENAQAMVKELGEGTFIIEPIEQTELDKFMQYVEHRYQTERELDCKVAHAILSMYKKFKEEE